MYTTNPVTGETIIRKRRRRYDIAKQARVLTFSCFHGYKFLAKDRTRQWLVEELDRVRREHPIELWAYVIMPEHAHVMVYACEEGIEVGRIIGYAKEEVARKAIQFLRKQSPEWLARITFREGGRIRRRFWQAGGGYDRNIIEDTTLAFEVDYLHGNPQRRGLVARAIEWKWSSAQWFAGEMDVPLAMDDSVREALCDI